MKTRFSLTIDDNVYETLRLQATILEIPLSRYINKILRDHLNIQSDEIESALRRLERQGKIKD